MAALTFNPHAKIVLRRRKGQIFAVSTAAPVRGSPLRVTTFSHQESPAIFDLLQGIAAGGAVDVALDGADWTQLTDAGLVVPANEIPSIPRFRCAPRDPPRDLLPRRARRSDAQGQR